MKILYAGSPDVSAIPLFHVLKEAKHEVIGVLTNPPSVQGRGKEEKRTELAQAIEKHPEYKAIPIFSPEKLDSDFRKMLSALKPDILVCFAYGKLFGPKFLALFPRGGINIHPSLLPMYRGCAPVPEAILNRDSQTGVSIQEIALEMDCGDILAQKTIELDGTETSESLLYNAAEISSKLLSKVLDEIEEGSVKASKQDGEKACYSAPFCKADGLLDWTSSALDIDAKIRAFTPWPGTFTYVEGKMLKILKASVFDSAELEKDFDKECRQVPGKVLGKDNAKGILIQTGKGILAVQELQWHTKKAMQWKDFLNGSQNFIGSLCGNKTEEKVD